MRPWQILLCKFYLILTLYSGLVMTAPYSAKEVHVEQMVTIELIAQLPQTSYGVITKDHILMTQAEETRLDHCNMERAVQTGRVVKQRVERALTAALVKSAHSRFSLTSPQAPTSSKPGAQ